MLWIGIIILIIFFVFFIYYSVGICFFVFFIYMYYSVGIWFCIIYIVFGGIFLKNFEGIFCIMSCFYGNVFEIVIV